MKKRRMDNLRAIREDRTVGYADDVETGNSVSGSSPEPPDAENDEEEQDNDMDDIYRDASFLPVNTIDKYFLPMRNAVERFTQELVIQIGEQIDDETNAEPKVDLVLDSESPSPEAVNGEETLEDAECPLWNQVSPVGGRRRHPCLKESALSGTSREEYKSKKMKKSQRQKMREKNERTKRAKEAMEKQIERFNFAVEAQKKLEEALQKSVIGRKTAPCMIEAILAVNCRAPN